MKKYKLLKTYPSLPADWETGMEIEQGENRGIKANFSSCNSKYNNVQLLYKEVVNYPEFWKKIDEDKFEILDQEYVPGRRVNGTPELMWEIKSIKRSSDNEILTVGDKFKPGKDTRINTIIGFEFTKYRQFRVVGDNSYMGLEFINKLKSLFTTENKIDIFEGDNFWFTNKQYELKYWDVNKMDTLQNNISFLKDKPKFSTKEEALRYINLNELAYSKQQILNIISKKDFIGTEYLKEQLKI